MPKFQIDYRKIDLIAQKRLNGIVMADIIELFSSDRSILVGSSDMKEVLNIGYVNGRKFIYAIFIFSKNHTFDVELLDVGIPNEKQIRAYWCKGGRNKEPDR